MNLITSLQNSWITPHAVDLRVLVYTLGNRCSPSVMCEKFQFNQVFVYHICINPDQPKYVKVFKIHKYASIFMNTLMCIRQA